MKKKNFEISIDNNIEIKFGKEKPSVAITCIAPVADNIGSILLTPIKNKNIEFGEQDCEDIVAEYGVYLTFYKEKSIDVLIEALNDIKINGGTR